MLISGIVPDPPISLLMQLAELLSRSIYIKLSTMSFFTRMVQSILHFKDDQKEVPMPPNGLEPPSCLAQCIKAQAEEGTACCVQCRYYKCSMLSGRVIMNNFGVDYGSLRRSDMPECYWTCYKMRVGLTCAGLYDGQKATCTACYIFEAKRIEDTRRLLPAAIVAAETNHFPPCYSDCLTNAIESKAPLCAACQEFHANDGRILLANEELKESEEEKSRLERTKKKLEEMKAVHDKEWREIIEEEEREIKEVIGRQKQNRKILEHKQFVSRYSLIGAYHYGKNETPSEVERRIEETFKPQTTHADRPECSICGTSQHNMRVAYVNCGHVACISCAKQWKTARDGWNVENVCLVCKTPGEFIRLFEN